MVGIEEKKLAGTKIGREDIEKGRVIYTRWRPDASYSWAAGVAMGRYLSELKKGRLVGVRCKSCRRVMIPPRVFCELCFKPVDEWVYLGDTGKVNTYAVSYIAADASRIKKPVIPAVIEIDGASKGMGILHLLGEVDPEKVRVGMRVKAVWRPEEERQGAITDIKYFKPL